jgi:hypothetical protein
MHQVNGAGGKADNDPGPQAHHHPAAVGLGRPLRRQEHREQDRQPRPLVVPRSHRHPCRRRLVQSTAWWAARGVTWGGFCPVSRPQRVAGYYVHPTEANPDAKPGEVIHFARCIAVAHLTDVHPAAGCCEPWGEDTYTDHQGRLRTDVVHLHLEDIRPLAEPVHVPRGQLGLWTPTSDLHEDILEAAGL